MNNKVRSIFFVLILTVVFVFMNEASGQQNQDLQNLNTSEGQGGAGGGQTVNCFWVQIAHARDYSWIKVMCGQSAYSDSGHPEKCFCGSANEIWYL